MVAGRRADLALALASGRLAPHPALTVPTACSWLLRGFLEVLHRQRSYSVTRGSLLARRADHSAKGFSGGRAGGGVELEGCPRLCVAAAGACAVKIAAAAAEVGPARCSSCSASTKAAARLERVIRSLHKFEPTAGATAVTSVTHPETDSPFS